MLNKVRLHFVIAATVALLLAFCLVFAPVYMLVTNNLANQIDMILDNLIISEGQIALITPGWQGGGNIFAPMVSEEQQYETRYFSIIRDFNGNIISVNTSHIASIDEEEAYGIGENAITMQAGNGRLTREGNIYFFRTVVHEKGYLSVFVDCTSRIWLIRQMMYYMFLVGIVILLIFCLILMALSKQIVAPFIRNSEKQKQFITNASHELKTPLAVISANTEMMEMLNGKSKWTDSTMRQIKRLNLLVSELVTLSRLEEKDEPVFSEVKVSEIVKEQADNFSQVILQQGKKFETSIAEGIRLKSESRSIQELTTIFLDNAAKYCDDSGTVKLELKKETRGAKLTVTNTYAEGAHVDHSRFFERFYREDQSHNSKKSGFGIGLSIARELCRQLGAKLSVSYKNGEISFAIQFK